VTCFNRSNETDADGAPAAMLQTSRQHPIDDKVGEQHDFLTTSEWESVDVWQWDCAADAPSARLTNEG
jgi:hypothetical protein